MKKSYVVIGMGRFGTSVAERLYELGNEVLAIDTDPDKVQRMESKVFCAHSAREAATARWSPSARIWRPVSSQP